MELNLDNYYSQEANTEYMSVSQYKDFEKCERYALAKLIGEYVEEKSKAMLVGGYVDAYFSNRLEQYKEEHPEIFKKDGTLLKDFDKANEVIEVATNDPLFMEHTKGKKQVILTGIIGGVKWKGAIDFLNEEDTTDLKVVASIREPVWVERNGRNIKTNFIDAYDYLVQGAIYQELRRQTMGELKPFNIAAISKEEEPDKAIIQIDNDILAEKLKEVSEKVGRYDLIKKGVIAPIGCGNCPVCRKLNRLTKVESYREFFGIGEENENDTISN